MSNYNVCIIAEACENHLGDMDTAKRMIDLAKIAGCNIVKFQHHRPEFEMKRGLKMSSNFNEDLYDFLLRCSLSIDQHKELYDYCNQAGIQYLCTPFCKEAAEDLVEAGLGDMFKIGSGEMNDFPLLKYLSDNKKKMLISTGMSSLDEIDETVVFLKSVGANFSLFHCVSEYPPSNSDIALDTISLLIKKYPDIDIGFSCHTPSIYTSLAAVTLGARFVEKHFILDKTQSCPDQTVSIDFEDLCSLVQGIRCLQEARGTRNTIYSKELEIRNWARHIVVAKTDIDPGDVITENNITTMRAGNGISSKYFYKLIGKTVSKYFKSGEALSNDFLS